MFCSNVIIIFHFKLRLHSPHNEAAKQWQMKLYYRIIWAAVINIENRADWWRGKCKTHTEGERCSWLTCFLLDAVLQPARSPRGLKHNWPKIPVLYRALGRKSMGKREGSQATVVCPYRAVRMRKWCRLQMAVLPVLLPLSLSETKWKTDKVSDLGMFFSPHIFFSIFSSW